MIFKKANWPAPNNISAGCTTRCFGYSLPPYDSNNLALHVLDNEALVNQNRLKLIKELDLPYEPIWLEQTHSTICIDPAKDSIRMADASVSRSYQYPLVILTADCLPILMCSKQGDEIAAIHAGWRGLCNGVIENTLVKMNNSKNDLLAWIGPAICQSCFEVGEEVFSAFTTKYPFTFNAFKSNQNKWLANLPQLAELILNNQGINAVYQSGLCTYELKNEFFSYRRASQTGRIGSLIWFNS